ncbi:MAG TPA: hypothetical protein GX734_04995 [Clostridiaceae bacterium]|nr:hypothetical protein [Clostridiaceae bacterium]
MIELREIFLKVRNREGIKGYLEWFLATRNNGDRHDGGETRIYNYVFPFYHVIPIDQFI